MFSRLQHALLSLFSVGIVLMQFVVMSTATAEPIKIGAIFALSGKAAKSNTPAVLGTELAVREANQMGGVLGRKVELLLIDNNSTPIGSHLAAEQAVKAGVTAIIGSVWSSHSMAIAKVAEKNKIPMISTNSTVPSLTAIGDYIFRVCYDDNFQGTEIARFVYQELNARTALVFVDIASDFSLNLTDIFKRTFDSLGGVIVREIEYKTGNSDYAAEVQQALFYNPDIVFLSGHDESGILASRLNKSGFKAIPIGSDGWDTDSFFLSGGNQIPRGYFFSHWHPDQEDPLSKAFLKKYANEGEIKSSTVLAYDAVNVLIAAIKKAGSTDGTAIRNNLQTLQKFKGITGTISFDAQGNATKRGCLMEIREGVPYYRNCRPTE